MNGFLRLGCESNGGDPEAIAAVSVAAKVGKLDYARAVGYDSQVSKLASKVLVVIGGTSGLGLPPPPQVFNGSFMYPM